jgi:ABC-type nitrate/sulfonate/bicarbonate transport system substrate-binding protein
MRNQMKVFATLIAVTAALCSMLGSGRAAVAAPTLTSLKIGWQSTWATQGQLSLILQKTPILEENGIKGEFLSFPYGGPLNEAALAGAVDVVLTADQPALTLLSKDPSWEIVGRLMYNSGAIVVPAKSHLNSVQDLKGKSVAVPFVAAVHRVLIRKEEEAGLKPGMNVTNINLGISEILSLAEAGKGASFGQVDAAALWDPAPLILEAKGLARTISRGDILALVLMRKPYSSDPALREKFMNAISSAYIYYRSNRQAANDWFTEAARLDFDSTILDKAASVEPNLQGSAPPNVTLSPEDMMALQDVERFMLQQKLITVPVDVPARVAGLK